MQKRFVRLFGRRLAGTTALVAAMALSASACSSSPEIVTVTTTLGQPLAPASQVAAPDLPSAGSSSTAPAPAGTTNTTSPKAADPNNVRITATPTFGTKNLGPNNPIKITVFAATITTLTMTGNDSRDVTGSLSSDKATWTTGQRLNYDTIYTVAGTALGSDGKQVNISGKFSTVKPKSTLRASIQIPDGATVGVGAPITLTFSGVVKNRAAAEAALKVTTSAGAALKGNWGWLQDEQIRKGGPVQSQVHWRPTASPVSGSTTPYWPAFTTVHVDAKLDGVDYGNGAWGREDFTSDFKTGRSQIVHADASTFHLIVTEDDKVTKNWAVSYGKESVPGRATVTGIHLVTEKFPEFAMCNPKFGYCNVKEKWAVRINNNGEFIHENLKALGAFGIKNVTHGCVNMNAGDAKAYYDSAIYGDPVEVTNTGGPPMSEKDSLYDWIYTSAEWQALSAL